MPRLKNTPETLLFARCLGTAMKVVRKRAGIKNEVMRQDINVTQQGISAWETGKVIPTINNLMAFCGQCNVPMWQVIRSAENVMRMRATMDADRVRQKQQQQAEDEE
jgi:DNA-binding XRE family transcriptional regulator